MILQYHDQYDQTHRIGAIATTKHPDSHYGVPVILLQDGKLLDINLWESAGYEMIKADKEELIILQNVLENFYQTAGLSALKQS